MRKNKVEMYLENESYIGLAEIYDKTIDVDYNKWIAFIEEFFEAKQIKLYGKKLLELGCGTGNMTFKLKERGMDITALDLSEEMLHNAKQKALKKRLKLLFINQNIKNFEINKTFEFVFSFCDGYNYVLEEKDLINSFKRVFTHLKVGGYFIFDISTPYKLKEKLGNNTFTQNEDDLSYIWDNYIEGEILEMYISFFVKEGSFYRRFKEHHIQRAWDINYIKEVLGKAGFKEIEVFEDYTNKIIENNSIRATFICKRED
jgi:ubiquinone/menaquinone biosynthesis C-methylase UbiE